MIQSITLLLRRCAKIAAAIVLITAPAASASPVPVSELAKPGRVLLLRHAIAPGVGDPPQFQLRDCTTQRNLDAAGRRQAAQLGKRIAGIGIRSAQVYAGQWCRTLETARLLGLGPVTELPALNSFFGQPDKREGNLEGVRKFLAALPADGPLVILVTHQVTVTGITGVYPESGGGAILELNGTQIPRIVGEFRGGD
jgi:phosphohistidine phosphatase SixA